MHCSFSPHQRVLFLLGSLVAVALFCGLSYVYWDVPLTRAVRTADPGVHEAFQLITRFGVSTGYLVASFLGFLLFRFFKRSEVWARGFLFVFASIALSGITVDLFKFIFGRFRPQMLNQGLYGFTFFQTDHPLTSFPSGHAATITALALSVSLLHRNMPLRVAAVPAVALVVASRVIIGAHYLSDVFFGSYVAAVTTLCLWRSFSRSGWADSVLFQPFPRSSVGSAAEGRECKGGEK